MIAVVGLFAWRKFVPRKPSETPSPELVGKKDSATPSPSIAAPPTLAPANQLPPPSNTTPLAKTKPQQTDSNTKKDLPSDLPQPTGFDLPDGWTRKTIGNVLNPNADFVSPRFDLSGAAEGFLTNGDSVLFVSTTNNANEFQATLLKIEIPSSVSRCGIMMRESEKPASPFLFIGASSENIYVYSRDSKGTFLSGEYEIPKANQNKPIYFRFQQKVNHVAPLYSYDSKNWLPNDTNALYDDRHTIVGLAVCSGSPSDKVVAKYGGVILFNATKPGK